MNRRTVRKSISGARNLARCIGGNGTGSTTTNARRFTSVTQGVDTSAVGVLVDSAVSGTYFFFSRDCKVFVGFREVKSQTSTQEHITINVVDAATDSVGATDPDGAGIEIEDSRGFAQAQSSTGLVAFASWEGTVLAGQKVACWSDSTSTNSQVRFWINLLEDPYSVGGD